MSTPLIVHVVEHALPEISGYSVRTHNLLLASQRRGWRVLAVVPRPGEGAAELEQIDGVSYLWLPTGRALGTVAGHLSGLPRFWRGLSEVLRHQGAALMHGHSPSRIGVAGLRAARAAGIPFVYELRGLWEDAAVDRGKTRVHSLRYQAPRTLETYVLRHSDAVVTICRGLAAEAQRRGVAPQRLDCAPNGVDAQHFAPRAPLPELIERFGLESRFVIGYVGYFLRYEGVDLLLQAFAAVAAKHSRARLLLVGDGDMESELRGQATALGLDGKVHFTGRLPHGAVADFYAICDVLTYPRRRSRSTELITPLKPLEAMAMERPVIASSVGGLAELVVSEDTGLLCMPDDVDSLTAALLRLLENPELGQRLAQQARMFAATRSWDRSVEGYDVPYATLLAGDGSGKIE